MAVHPNSLKNLKPHWTSETARESQKNSVIARKANSAAREALKMTAKDMELFKKEMKGVEVSAVEMLKMLMLKSFQEEDFDTAADLAKALAEFQTPKLARQDLSVEEKTVEDYTDEEIEAKIKEILANGKDDSTSDS